MSGDPFSTAQALEGAGRLEQAIAEYARLIGAGTGGAEPLVRKAILHKERGELAILLSDLEEAERLEPQSIRVALILAETYTSICRDILAVGKLQHVLTLSADLPEVRVNLAAIASRLAWFDVGYSAVRVLPEGLPDWWAQARKTGLDQYRAARSELIDLLRRRRAEGLTHEIAWKIAVKLSEVGRLTLCRRLCEHLIALHPRDFGSYDLLSRVVARVEGPAKALAFLRELQPELQAANTYPIRVSRCLLELGRFQEASQELASRPDVADNFDARFMGAVCLFVLQDHGALERHCRAWMDASPQDVWPCGIIACAQPVHVESDSLAATDLQGVELIQFWDAPEVPDDVDHTGATWSRHHPELIRRVFSEEEGRQFLEDNLGSEYTSVFDICHHAAMKADYFRIAYLLKTGGLYVDMDECCLAPMPAILAEATKAEFAAVRSGDLLGYLHNFFLAARPNSRPMALALDDATAAIDKAAREGRKPSIWEVTGPGLITRAVGRYLVQRGDEGLTSGDYLIPLKQWRSRVRNASELDYKNDASANWQLQ